MKVLRAFLLALLISFLIGIAIGAVLRARLQRPVRYIGLAPASLPFDVGYARAPVLEAGEHEEQVG